MTRNVGNAERIARILAGTVGWWGWLGLVPLATGLIGWCPPYAMLGINTCRTAPKG